MRIIFFIFALLLSCSFSLKLSSHSLENRNEIIYAYSLDQIVEIYNQEGPIIAYFTAGKSCKACEYLNMQIEGLAHRFG